MYRPAHFVEDREAVLLDAIARHPLALVVSAGPDGLVASHLPLLATGSGQELALAGHFARANPHWQAVAAGAETLVMFQGENAYVSPGWYETKRETGRAVPTWNYLAVEARGRCEAIEDPDWLHAHVAGLSALHEAPMAEPWSVEDAPARYIEQMKRAIVGFRMRVSVLQGKWKLSQNRPAVDRAGVLAGLGTHPIAAHIREAG